MEWTVPAAPGRGQRLATKCSHPAAKCMDAAWAAGMGDGGKPAERAAGQAAAARGAIGPGG